MAKGDFTPKRWIHKALTATATDSSQAGAANVRRHINAINLLNTGATARTVSIYVVGTAVVDEIQRIPLAAGGSETLTELPYFVDVGESFSVKQNTGTDVNLTVWGAEEALT